ncbi:MAG: (d)CMP kinase [Victivallales bacterium]|nr:(d)CMP kinase [Victivallales bacterium]
MSKFLLTSLLTVMLLTGYAQNALETRFVGERTIVVRDGIVLDFKTCLAEQLKAHPSLQAEDVQELCERAAYGPGRVSASAAKQQFMEEYKSLPVEDLRAEPPIFEIISPDFMRIDLRAWKASQMPAEWLFNMYLASIKDFEDSNDVWSKNVEEALEVLDGERKYNFVKRHLSSIYHPRQAKSFLPPSYRLVVSTRFLHALPVLVRCAALADTETVKVIAIDGRSASGKTTLAKQLAQILSADVVQMDDFFLPLALRTEKRYQEAGGNVHYERFAEEVLPHLRQPGPFSYRQFDCSTMGYGESKRLQGSSWRIVEGAYSLHPKFGDYADLKIFYDISPEEQMRRITLRNGKEKAEVFRNRWIPLEENYINQTDVISRADLVLGRR